MKNKLREQFPQTAYLRRAAAAFIVCLVCGGVAAATDDDRDGESRRETARQLRQFIDQQVGGIDKLKVPATDADIPLPRQADGTVNYRYQTTEAKRYLGKLLFHDPVRTARININTGQPVDLPTGTAFGGQLKATDPDIQAIVDATKQTGSCGSCHIGEAAGKAGQAINLNVGGEGRGYTDANGNFFPRRRPQLILPKIRTEPLFSGDVLADSFATLTDIDIDSNGNRVVATPSLFYHTPPPRALLATGRLDDLDSVARTSMNLVGFAFNTRLLFGGFAGEPPSAPGSLNPFNDPAQENLTLLLLDAHRMLNFQSAELLKIPAFVKLFREAFPVEAAQADAQNDPTLLVNDQTVLRATSTFLRTIVTRNTPFDKFLAGDDKTLTTRQLRGAKLFFTPATEGGAGCFSCHSGPMLNKQYNDPEVAGIGQFVEENFFNVGIGDHPVQALNALARGHIDPAQLGPDGFPYHAEDVGRQEITQNANDTFKFRSLTLRQLKDARNFFHNASLTSVRDVIEYFNAGVPQDPTAGAAVTLSPRFTNPRGPGLPNGLGLTSRQVDDLTDFIENGLYDPALAHYDPKSTTPFFQPDERDLTYSKYRPDLAALGAKDGFMLSGLAIDSNDPLTRRDEGLEFLDVTSRLSTQTNRFNVGNFELDICQITNTSSSVVDTHLLVIGHGLSPQIQWVNRSGFTSGGDPYLRVFLPDGVLNPGQSTTVQLVLLRSSDASQANYTLSFLSGQGKP